VPCASASYPSAQSLTDLLPYGSYGEVIRVRPGDLRLVYVNLGYSRSHALFHAPFDNTFKRGIQLQLNGTQL